MMAKRMREPGIEEQRDAKRVAANKVSKSARSLTKPKSSTASKKTEPQAVAAAKAKKPGQDRNVGKGKETETGKIIVGIDYGTTYSGASFVAKTGTEARDVTVITSWPGCENENEQYDKVPSRLAYASENPILNDRNAWGMQVRAGLKCHTGIKLLLDRGAKISKFDANQLHEIHSSSLMGLPPTIEPEDGAAAFLRLLYHHVLHELERYFGEKVLSIKSIEYWFTYPATWSDAATSATRNAAHKAGFAASPTRRKDTLFMISEPEAAAIAVLSSMNETTAALYQKNTNVLIADLGGGTLDFQCLTIKNTSPLKVEETIPGIGGKSGGIYVDCEFYRWMSKTFGQAFNDLDETKLCPGSSFFSAWESRKRNFDGNFDTIHRLRFPPLGHALKKENNMCSSYDFEEFQVLVSGRDIAQMFEPMLTKAFELVKDQAQALKKARKPALSVVILCGGMGNNTYVWSRFKQFCTSQLQNVELVTDPKAWSAVVRGAAIRGLSGAAVFAKKARRWYGVQAHDKFVEGFDREEDAFECPINGKRAEKHVGWVVKRGMNFHPKFKAELPLYIPLGLGEDEDDLNFEWDLYICDREEAPKRIWEEGVQKIASISLDLSNSFKWPKRKTIDQEYQKADVKIVMKFGDERGILIVEALHGRKVVGTARIDYGKDHIRQPMQRMAGLIN